MYQDVGVDQNGDMEVLIPRDTELPHEFSCRVRMNDLNILALYEGNYVDTCKNNMLGLYTLENTQDGFFTLTLKVDASYNLVITIDDRTVDRVKCIQVPNAVPVEERRLWLNARNEFRDYIQSTTLFVQDPLTQQHLPEWKWVLEKLEWAKEIMDYEVSAEEYEESLKEIEQMINPILQKTYHKKVFEKSPLLE